MYTTYLSNSSCTTHKNTRTSAAYNFLYVLWVSKVDSTEFGHGPWCRQPTSAWPSFSFAQCVQS